MDSTFEQWYRLEQLLKEEDNLANLHKLLAIYFRPYVKGIFKGGIEKYIDSKQDELANTLLDLPMRTAYTIVMKFYSVVIHNMYNMKIPYLNELNREMNNLLEEEKINDK